MKLQTLNLVEAHKASKAAFHTLEQSKAEAATLSELNTAVAKLATTLAGNTDLKEVTSTAAPVAQETNGAGDAQPKKLSEVLSDLSTKSTEHAKSADHAKNRATDLIARNKKLAVVGLGFNALFAAITAIANPILLLVPAAFTPVVIKVLEFTNLYSVLKVLGDIKKAGIDSIEGNIKELQTAIDSLTGDQKAEFEKQLNEIVKLRDQLLNPGADSVNSVVSGLIKQQTTTAATQQNDSSDSASQASEPTPAERLKQKIAYTLERVKEISDTREAIKQEVTGVSSHTSTASQRGHTVNQPLEKEEEL